MGMCAAIVRGVKGECQRPVPEDAPIKLCLLHGLLAHQWIGELGGPVTVADRIKVDTGRDIALIGATAILNEERR